MPRMGETMEIARSPNTLISSTRRTCSETERGGHSAIQRVAPASRAVPPTESVTAAAGFAPRSVTSRFHRRSDRGETVHVLVRPPAEGDPPACRDMVEERGPHRADPPVAVLARERHGSMRAVAIMLDTPEATIRGYAYNTKRKRVPPATARRIVTLVLAHRKHPRPLDIWEEQPGLRPFVPLQLRRKRS
jgi:hypothetical protein